MAKTFTQDTIKGIKKGDKFTVVSFTGMNLGQYEVTAVSKTQFKTVKAKGDELIFNRADGTQANANNPKYANKAVDLMDAPERKSSKPKKAKSSKVSKEQLPLEADFEGEEEDEDWEDA